MAQLSTTYSKYFWKILIIVYITEALHYLIIIEFNNGVNNVFVLFQQLYLWFIH